MSSFLERIAQQNEIARQETNRRIEAREMRDPVDRLNLLTELEHLRDEFTGLISGESITCCIAVNTLIALLRYEMGRTGT